MYKFLKKELLRYSLKLIKKFKNEQIVKDFIYDEFQKSGLNPHTIYFNNYSATITPSWKNYYSKNFRNIDKLFNDLFKDLDDLSINIAETYFERNVFFDVAKLKGNLSEDDISYIENSGLYGSYFNKLYTEQEKIEQKKLFSSSSNNPLTYYKHGLSFIEDFSKDYLIGKDFIDGGAYIGDTIIAFKDDCSGKIYSFEPNDINYEKLKATIKKYNLEHMVIPVKKGLGAKEEIINFYGGDSTFSAGEI